MRGEGEVLSVVHLLTMKIDRLFFILFLFLAVKIDRSVPKMHVSKMKMRFSVMNIYRRSSQNTHPKISEKKKELSKFNPI